MSQTDIDLIVVNGKIWTCNPRQKEAEAFAVRGNRLVQVGSSSEILALRDSRTTVIDARGRRITPGFNDAHVHFYWGGMNLSCVQLRDVRSPAEFRERIGGFAASLPAGEWILWGGWDPEGWSPPALPTHDLIDDVTPRNPVFVSRSDAHSGLANALAMRLAGVDRNTPDIPGGEIQRDDCGNPTGVFKEGARALIERFIPKPSDEQIIERILAAQNHAAQCGVTSVQDMGFVRVDDSWPDILRVYQGLHAEGKLKVRVLAHHRLAGWRSLAESGVVSGFGTDKLKIGAIKAFGDGSLGSATAWFFEPYTDPPGTCGMPSDEMSEPALMYRNLEGADKAGLQLAIHAIGDRANHEVLRMYERLDRENGSRDRRPRIEHAQHLRREDIPRFKKLGVIASVQPYHAIDDGRWAEKRIGLSRLPGTYAFRSLLDAGAVLAFGTDWMVAPLDPLQTIYAAVTRRTLDDRHPGGWMPEERLTVAEAVHAYAMGSAYAESEERVKGSLEAGKLADAVILSEDIFECPSTQIRNVRIEMTIFDGKVIYAAT